MTRFEQRPSESRIEAARQPPVVSLTEVNQLRKALKVAQARAEKAGLLEYEVRELRKDLHGAETHKETIGSQNREIVRQAPHQEIGWLGRRDLRPRPARRQAL